mgnify:CR=1 FL=1
MRKLDPPNPKLLAAVVTAMDKAWMQWWRAREAVGETTHTRDAISCVLAETAIQAMRSWMRRNHSR